MFDVKTIKQLNKASRNNLFKRGLNEPMSEHINSKLKMRTVKIFQNFSELKETITEVENSLGELNGRLEGAEERASEAKGVSVEII